MKQLVFDDNCSGAEFSECRKFRYSLWRIWDERKKGIAFIGKTYKVNFYSEDCECIWKTNFFWKDIKVKNGDKIKIIGRDTSNRTFWCKLNKEEYEMELTFEFVENMIDKGLLRLK